MSDAPYLRLDDGEGPRTFRVMGLGAVAFLAEPNLELGFVVDLVSLENQPPSQDHPEPPDAEERRYLLSPGQVAELIVELLKAGRAGGPAMRELLLEALEGMAP